MRNILPGEFYKHFKNKLYQVKGIAYHSETKEKMVVYQAMYGDFKWYVRPYDMFAGEVDHAKYPDAAQKYRFEKVEILDIESDTPDDINTKNAPDIEITENTENTITTAHLESKEDKNTEKSLINPALEAFLDAKSYREKINILVSIRNKMDDRLVNDIATSMDITVPDGPIEERYMSLKQCVMTHAKYEESNRLR